MTTIETKKDFDYSAEHAKKVREQNQKALEDNECYLFQTTRVESTYRTNADIVRSNPVVDMRELEMACLKDACAWYSVHRHFLHEKLMKTERELKALKRQLKTGEKPNPKTETMTGVGRLITTMCGGDEETAMEILKTQTETGVTQFHTCDECHRYCYTGGDLYPDGYTCADCDDEESEEEDDESDDE
jgi:hypothetical protein